MDMRALRCETYSMGIAGNTNVGSVHDHMHGCRLLLGGVGDNNLTAYRPVPTSFRDIDISVSTRLYSTLSLLVSDVGMNSLPNCLSIPYVLGTTTSGGEKSMRSVQTLE